MFLVSFDHFLVKSLLKPSQAYLVLKLRQQSSMLSECIDLFNPPIKAAGKIQLVKQGYI